MYMYMSEVGGASPLMDPPTGKSCSVFVSCVTCEAVREFPPAPGRCAGPVSSCCSSPAGPRVSRLVSRPVSRLVSRPPPRRGPAGVLKIRKLSQKFVNFCKNSKTKKKS